MTTMQERKDKATELLRKLDIFKPYINAFETKGTVCEFENYGGFCIEQDSPLGKKIKEVEAKYACMVYAVTHEYTDFGECYSLLILPNERDDWDYLINSFGGNQYYVYAYVWNKTDDSCSEFGTIGVRSFGGGIKRFA